MKQRKWTRNNLLATLLILVSLLAIAPSLTNALQQNGTISINASGQANPIPKKGTGGAASLSLSGNIQSQGNDPMKFNGLFGTLTIIGTNYPVTGGRGEMNNKGKFEIQAKASGNELILHGTMQGGNVVIECPQSKLASQYFLCLTGQVNITTSSSSGSTSSSSTSSESEDDEEEEEGTVTQTVTQSITQTVTNNQTSTTTVLGNQTVTETLNGTTTTVFGNQTVTESITVPQNITTTTTEFNQTITTTVTEPINQTITTTITATVANSTITQTTTTTVANVTITETTTTTAANTTITVTNTTTLIVP